MPFKRGQDRRVIRSRTVTLVLSACAAAIPAGRVSAERAEDGAPSVAAQSTPVAWNGAIELPGGQKLEFAVELRATSGTMDIPIQGLSKGELHDVASSEAELRFTLKPPGATEPAWAVFALKVAEDGQSAAGTMKQMGREFPVSVSRGERAQLKRPQHPQPPFTYSSRDVTYVNPKGGHTLAGTLTIPQGKGPHPAALLLTGSGAQDRDSTLMGHKLFLVIADALTRAGVAVLRVDDRGVGGSTLPPDVGPLDMTTFDFADDALAGLEYMKSQAEIDAARLGLIGHSEGGIIGPIVASKSADVKFLIMLAGTGVSGRQVMEAQGAAIMRGSGMSEDIIALQSAIQRDFFDRLERGEKLEDLRSAVREMVRRELAKLRDKNPDDASLPNEELFTSMVDQQIEQFSGGWFRAFLTYDPAESLRRVRASVLVLNGERDLQVLPDQNLPAIERALAEAGNTDVTVRRLPELNHLFQTARTGTPDEYEQIEETIAPAALEAMVTWLRPRVGLEAR